MPGTIWGNLFPQSPCTTSTEVTKTYNSRPSGVDRAGETEHRLGDTIKTLRHLRLYISSHLNLTQVQNYVYHRSVIERGRTAGLPPDARSRRRVTRRRPDRASRRVTRSLLTRSAGPAFDKVAGSLGSSGRRAAVVALAGGRSSAGRGFRRARGARPPPPPPRAAPAVAAPAPARARQQPQDRDVHAAASRRVPGPGRGPPYIRRRRSHALASRLTACGGGSD